MSADTVPETVPVVGFATHARLTAVKYPGPTKPLVLRAPNIKNSYPDGIVTLISTAVALFGGKFEMLPVETATLNKFDNPDFNEVNSLPTLVAVMLLPTVNGSPTSIGEITT
jgi:hypothetical protein